MSVAAEVVDTCGEVPKIKLHSSSAGKNFAYAVGDVIQWHSDIEARTMVQRGLASWHNEDEGWDDDEEEEDTPRPRRVPNKKNTKPKGRSNK